MKMAQVIVFVFILAAVVSLALIFGIIASGEEAEKAWVMCQPDSYINVRMFPKKDSERAGYLMAGDQVYVDGVVKRGFVHIIHANTESGDGWVAKGYIVYSEAVAVGHDYLISAKGRVAARRTAGGNRRCWLYDGNQITVYFRSDEWCLTNRGFVKTDFIDFSQCQDIVHLGADELIFEED